MYYLKTYTGQSGRGQYYRDNTEVTTGCRLSCLTSDLGGVNEAEDPTAVKVVDLWNRVNALSCDNLKPEASAIRKSAHVSRSKILNVHPGIW